MGTFSLSHWIVVALVVLVLFGRGKVSETMGDFGKGIRSFKKGLLDADEPDLVEVPSSVKISKASADAAAHISPKRAAD